MSISRVLSSGSICSKNFAMISLELFISTGTLKSKLYVCLVHPIFVLKLFLRRETVKLLPPTSNPLPLERVLRKGPKTRIPQDIALN